MCKPEIGAGAKHRCRGELLAVCFVLLSRGPGENVACRAEAERLAAGRGLGSNVLRASGKCMWRSLEGKPEGDVHQTEEWNAVSQSDTGIEGFLRDWDPH